MALSITIVDKHRHSKIISQQASSPKAPTLLRHEILGTLGMIFDNERNGNQSKANALRLRLILQLISSCNFWATNLLLENAWQIAPAWNTPRLPTEWQPSIRKKRTSASSLKLQRHGSSISSSLRKHQSSKIPRRSSLRYNKNLSRQRSASSKWLNNSRPAVIAWFTAPWEEQKQNKNK